MVTASCGVEPKGVLPYKPLVDEAIDFSTHKPTTCIVYQRSMVCVYLSFHVFYLFDTARLYIGDYYQLLDEVEHNIKDYQGRCSAAADNS